MTPADRPLRLCVALAGLILAATAAGGAHAAAPPQDAAAAGLRPYVEAFGAQTGATVPTGPLSTADARTYAAAFEAVRKGQFTLADSIVQAVQDTTLQGRLQYAKLMHAAYHSTYGELKAWLDNYRDQPGADRIFILAKKRRASEAAVVSDAASDAAAPAPADTGPAAPISGVDRKLQMSREAFYAGDTDTAYRLATASGERWIAGLASFRLGKFDEAFKWLSELSQDQAQTEWVRSAAAWWAARSAATAGLTEEAAPYLKLAAATPYTFYGLIAARQLGLDSATTLAPTPDLAAPERPFAFTRASDAQVTLTPAMLELLQSDPRARRAAALVQAGMRLDAGLELRTAMLGAGDPEARKTWRALAAYLDAPLSSPDDLGRTAYRRFDPAQFEAPDLSPKGGFTLEKSLVYAIVRQESRFNAAAASAAGAYGLMQLMPATAAVIKGDPSHPVPAATLKNPGENLRLGQDYVAKILSAVDGDLIRAVASYNSGPKTILKTVARLGADADSLLVIESMPGGETREFVHKVMANYWIYRKLWGQPSPSLDAVAAGAGRVPAMLDANNGKGAQLARAD